MYNYHLPMYEQALTPIMGPMMNPSMLKSSIKEIQRNTYIIDVVRQRQGKYWYNACTSLEHIELLSKRATIHSPPKN